MLDHGAWVRPLLGAERELRESVAEGEGPLTQGCDLPNIMSRARSKCGLLRPQPRASSPLLRLLTTLGSCILPLVAWKPKKYSQEELAP